MHLVVSISLSVSFAKDSKKNPETQVQKDLPLQVQGLCLCSKSKDFVSVYNLLLFRQAGQ